MPKRKRVEDYPEADASPETAGDDTVSQPERERVAQRAYELYLARGGADGQADEDWFSAERELTVGGRSRGES